MSNQRKPTKKGANSQDPAAMSREQLLHVIALNAARIELHKYDYPKQLQVITEQAVLLQRLAELNANADKGRFIKKISGKQPVDKICYTCAFLHKCSYTKGGQCPLLRILNNSKEAPIIGLKRGDVPAVLIDEDKLQHDWPLQN